MLLLEVREWYLRPNDGEAATTVFVRVSEGIVMTVGVLPLIRGLEVSK